MVIHKQLVSMIPNSIYPHIVIFSFSIELNEASENLNLLTLTWCWPLREHFLANRNALIEKHTQIHACLFRKSVMFNGTALRDIDN